MNNSETTHTQVFIPLIFAFILAGWFCAEFRGNIWMRITSGFLLALSFGFFGYYAGQVIPRYESDYHRTALQDLGHIAQSGDLPRVQNALSVYNEVAGRSGSTYTAAQKMFHTISSHPPADQK